MAINCQAQGWEFLICMTSSRGPYLLYVYWDERLHNLENLTNKLFKFSVSTFIRYYTLEDPKGYTLELKKNINKKFLSSFRKGSIG